MFISISLWTVSMIISISLWKVLMCINISECRSKRLITLWLVCLIISTSLWKVLMFIFIISTKSLNVYQHYLFEKSYFYEKFNCSSWYLYADLNVYQHMCQLLISPVPLYFYVRLVKRHFYIGTANCTLASNLDRQSRSRARWPLVPLPKVRPKNVKLSWLFWCILNISNISFDYRFLVWIEFFRRLLLMLISVTIFGEIPRLWQNFKTLRQLFKGLISVGQNFQPTLASLLCYLANFHSSKWPNIKQLI